MKKCRYFTVFMLFVSSVFFSSCSQDKNEAVLSPNEIQESDISIIQKSPRESSHLKKAVSQNNGIEDVNPDDYELIIKDNENYYYFLNNSNSGLYKGKAYYCTSGKYNYRGEARLFIFSSQKKSCTLFYNDVRYENDNLCNISAEIPATTYYGKLYWQKSDRTWSISLTITKREF